MQGEIEVMGGVSGENGGIWIGAKPDESPCFYVCESEPTSQSSEMLKGPDGLRLVYFALEMDEKARKSWRGTREKSLQAARFGEAILRDLAPRAVGNSPAKIGEMVWRALRNQIPEKDGDFSPRLACEYAIYEVERARKWARFLELARENPASREPFLRGAGELMIQSHFSLDHRRNLRDARADELVEKARKIGVSGGVYGAKISVNAGEDGDEIGVVVLGEAGRDWLETLEKFAQRLAKPA